MWRSRAPEWTLDLFQLTSVFKVKCTLWTQQPLYFSDPAVCCQVPSSDHPVQDVENHRNVSELLQSRLQTHRQFLASYYFLPSNSGLLWGDSTLPTGLQASAIKSTNLSAAYLAGPVCNAPNIQNLFTPFPRIPKFNYSLSLIGFSHTKPSLNEPCNTGYENKVDGFSRSLQVDFHSALKWNQWPEGRKSIKKLLLCKTVCGHVKYL